MKSWVSDALVNINLSREDVEKLVEVPKDTSRGDYAFPCFTLAKQFKKSPGAVAEEIVSNLAANEPHLFERIVAEGPYVNFFINRQQLARDTLQQIKKDKDKYGLLTTKKKYTIVLEMSSPNIAKPFGIGHLRSTIIGNALASIAQAQGNKVIRINYLGDWGTQFGKLILGYNLWGNKKELKKDPVKHLLDLYVKVNQDATLEDAAREAFAALEQGNTKYKTLWKAFRKMSLVSFNQIYKQLGVSFDVMSGESEYNEKKEAVLALLKKKGLLVESDGALIVDLKEYDLGVCLIQKKDGTTLYATRDLAAAIDRYESFAFDEMWYEVGAEQKLHFKQIFKVLELLGYSWATKCKHIDHGLYLDEDGKKFATRKGKTMFMEGILAETKELAKQEIKKREPKLAMKEQEKRAQALAVASILYGDLKNYRGNDMVFNIERFVSFEGDTGPYLLYAIARAKSVLRKARYKPQKQYDLPELNEQEKRLFTLLSQFGDVITTSYNQQAPHILATYAYHLAQTFNEYYHHTKIIGSEHEQGRLETVAATVQVLKNTLSLLHIPIIEKM